jgi:hypothetical protein
MVDVMFALVLSFLVAGETQNIIVTYTNTIEECETRASRINYIISKYPEATNIEVAKCKMLNVHINYGESA